MNKGVTSFWLRGHKEKSLGEFGVSLILKRTIRKDLSFTGLWVLLDDNVILGAAAALLKHRGIILNTKARRLRMGRA